MDHSFKKLACMCQSMVDLSSGEIDLSYGTIECLVSSDKMLIGVTADYYASTMKVVVISEDTTVVKRIASHGHGKVSNAHRAVFKDEWAWFFINKLYKEVIR